MFILFIIDIIVLQRMAAYKPIYSKQKEWVNTGTTDGEIMVFHPTLEEFANFSKYVQTIEQSNAHLASGICKVNFEISLAF